MFNSPGQSTFYNHMLTIHLHQLSIISQGFQIGTQELEEMGMSLCEAMLHLKSKDRSKRLPQDKGTMSDESVFHILLYIMPLFPKENLLGSYSNLQLLSHKNQANITTL